MEKIAIWLQKGYLKKKAEKSEYSPMVSEIIHGILTRFTMHNLKNHSMGEESLKESLKRA